MNTKLPRRESTPITPRKVPDESIVRALLEETAYGNSAAQLFAHCLLKEVLKRSPELRKSLKTEKADITDRKQRFARHLAGMWS